MIPTNFHRFFHRGDRCFLANSVLNFDIEFTPKNTRAPFLAPLKNSVQKSPVAGETDPKSQKLALRSR